MRTKSILLLFILYWSQVDAQINTHQVTLSAIDQTLMAFPSPVLASSCQPGGILEVMPVEAPPEPIPIESLNQKAPVNLPERNNGLGNFITITPNGKTIEKVVCSLKLINKSVYNLVIKLDTKVIQPYVDLSIEPEIPLFDSEKPHVRAFLNLMSDLRDYVFNKLPLPETGGYYSSKEASYKLLFHGNQDKFYGAVLEVRNKKSKKNILLKSPPIGKVYLSSLDKKIFYILSKTNFEWEQLKTYLP